MVIGNCQGGWAVMMAAAASPELFGPIIVAGAPLAYWNGVRGRNPMRYTGGLNGGSWMTALAGDLGAGIFDGAYLVENFEKMNPSNTLWTKQYNLYANIDTEGPRYLGFEKWWGGHVLLNAEEMQWIVDNLFVGNKLATAEIVTADGVRLDLRNIKSPIICFCSQGDDITPPQQALGWILDLYENVADIRANGQTIVYCVHDKIGHLGIFVSGGVAKKEHAEFASNIDFIDCLPPGLYEAVLTPAGAHENRDGLVVGDYLVRFEHRSLDAIRALGANDLEDERAFAAVARLSEINLGLYRTMLQPLRPGGGGARSGRGQAAAEPVSPAIRTGVGPEPAARPAAYPGRAGAGTPPAGGGRQSVPGRPGNVVAADRGGTGCLSRPARRSRRGRVLLHSTARRSSRPCWACARPMRRRGRGRGASRSSWPSCAPRPRR